MYLDQIAHYWDKRAHGYARTIQEQLSGKERDLFQALLRKQAPAGQSLQCLDVGCGPGFFSILLAQDGHQVTAMDYSQGMLEQAQQHFNEAGVSVATLQGDAQSLPFADASFDFVVSRNLVWNLEQPEMAYLEWLRVLRPGGRILVVDGNHYRHYYDEDYLAAKGTDSLSRHPACYGVDPAPINEIARDLPLSRVPRPNWDIDWFLDQGVERIDVQVQRKNFIERENGQSRSLIMDFVLGVEKPAGEKQPSDLRRVPDMHDDWTFSSDNYDRIIHAELESFRAPAWTSRILAQAPQKDTLDVLDVGCGPAFFSIILSQAGHRVVGLDGSDGMLRHAADNAADYAVQPLFVKGDCQVLPFVDRSFDLVISRNVTHALRDHAQAYAEWQRVLKPGGVLLIFDANWHLMHTDRMIRREFARRETACIERFGSNFSGGKLEVESTDELPGHLLGTCVRPGWDVPILRAAGFADVTYEENIIPDLWDEKEKLLYGATPMFMIRAVK
ncbi:MAG: methyltransferase domain-containing protein [Eubacteriales bacterium]|nr:methyltransferase domain-containing protein [Eubacteriales bacterium]